MRVRLQKVLAERGVCARRKAEQLIVAGRVRVNGATVTELGARVDPDVDLVEVDDRPVEAAPEHVYLVLNKPRGVVTACEDDRGATTVNDLVDTPQRLFPVGRLDKNSTGLVLLTNDGELALRLTHPRYGHAKEYDVTLTDALRDAHLAQLRAGVELEDGPTRPADVTRRGPRRFTIVLREGRKRQIRRMCAAVGATVARLTRTRIENLALGDLASGAWRHVTNAELRELQRRVAQGTTPSPI
jgi:23S rRNA pseudouridine2605 synthase/23S rRNA pseudouridine2604 synthase